MVALYGLEAVSEACAVALEETQIRQLHTGEYLRSARNVVFVGGTGTGKTHLATALAREVVLKGMRARRGW